MEGEKEGGGSSQVDQESAGSCAAVRGQRRQSEGVILAEPIGNLNGR